ncbi:MAG: hypothetical protein JXA50_01905 [Deltaproteobacteria bacterium]|nr:hypothetical protein [Deltaproteobacteria bacterium]
MSENTKKVLAAIGLIILVVGVLWIIWDLITALVICGIYFAGWLFNPPRFWKFLGWAGIGLLRLFGLIKQ